jgi:hypothetical protein
MSLPPGATRADFSYRHDFFPVRVSKRFLIMREEFMARNNLELEARDRTHEDHG